MSLNNLLNKLGIKSVVDLNEEEKKTYQQWQQVLDKKEITTKEIKEFIEGQISIFTEQLLSYKNTERKDIYLKAQLRNFRTLLAFINSPEINKAFLENYLKNIERGGEK